MKLTMTLMCTAALLAVQASSAYVQANGQKFAETITVQSGATARYGDHVLTFSGPVALPGVSLGAGTYVFRHPANNVLQVTTAAGQPTGMFMTNPTVRSGSLDNYAIVLGEPVAAGAPKRIVALFEAGQSTGQEFVYPKR